MSGTPGMDDLRRAGIEQRLARFRADLEAEVRRTRRGRIVWWLSGRYARLRRRRFASGGTLPYCWPEGNGMDDDDLIPVILSPGRSTTLRPGETHLEAMDRLMEGEDL